MRVLIHIPLAVLLLLAPTGFVGCSALGQTDSDVVSAVEHTAHRKAERLHRRGVDLLKSGRSEKAEAAFHNALLADETHGPALNNIGLVYYDKGDLYSAAWSFERAMAAMPDRPEPVNNLGMALEAAGRFDDAIEMYQSAWALDPSNPELLGNLVRTKLRRGDGDFSVFEELQELIFIETRPEWRVFAQHQLTMLLRATSGNSPEVAPPEALPPETLELLPP